MLTTTHSNLLVTMGMQVSTGLDSLLHTQIWLGSFMFFCLVFVMPLCASVYMYLVITCWERAELLALVCGV